MQYDSHDLCRIVFEPSERAPPANQLRTRTGRPWKIACGVVGLVFSAPLLGQEVQPAHDNDAIVTPRSEASVEGALAEIVESYLGIAKSLDRSTTCDLRQLCNDERLSVQISDQSVRLIFGLDSQPSIQLASVPVTAINASNVSTGRHSRIGSAEWNFSRMHAAMSVLNQRAANREMLYRFPDARDNPFLPWPPRTPSTFDDVTTSFQTRTSLGEIARKIREVISPRGYDSLRYFSVPGGFAVSTDLERVGRRRPVSGRDRWTIGKRGGFGNLFDYWTRLLAGEDDRFRAFVFIVTDADIQHLEHARQADWDSWKGNGRPALSRERASAYALENTRVWLYTYEFRASRSKDAELISNLHDPLRSRQNKLAVGFAVTRQIALQRMFALWLSAASLLILLMIAQVLAGKYGEHISVPLSWISGQIVPVLGLLVAAVFSSPSQSWKRKLVTDNRYLLAKAVSFVQIGAILLVILIEPILPNSSFELFDQTIFFFSIWQGVVTACVAGLVFDGR